VRGHRFASFIALYGVSETRELIARALRGVTLVVMKGTHARRIADLPPWSAPFA
jgi:hypothetical protein